MSDVGHEEPFDDDDDRNGLREVSATALAVLELLGSITARRPLSASQAFELADHVELLNQRALAEGLNAHLVRTRALYAAPLTWKKRHSRVGYLPSTHQTWRAEVKLVGHAISERRLRSIAGRSARAFRNRLNDGSHHPLSSEMPLDELVSRLRLHELLTDPLLDESEHAPKPTRQKLPARCYKRRAAIRRSDVPLLEALVVLCTNGASPTPDVFDLSYSLAVVELGGAPSILPGEQDFAISVEDPEHFDESQVVLEFVDARQKAWRREFSGRLQLHRT